MTPREASVMETAQLCVQAMRAEEHPGEILYVAVAFLETRLADCDPNSPMTNEDRAGLGRREQELAREIRMTVAKIWVPGS